MTWSCKCTETEMCEVCLAQMMAEHPKVHVDPAGGWEGLKKEIASIWPRKLDREKVQLKIADFYCNTKVASKSGTWLFLGRSPKPVIMHGTAPTVWLYQNEIRIETAQHIDYIRRTKQAYWSEGGI